MGKGQTPSSPIYRYGFAAWVWRLLIAGALGGSGLLGVLAVLQSTWVPLLVAAPLSVPALFFGYVVATEVTLSGEDAIAVRTLLCWTRRLAKTRLGRARVRTRVEESFGTLHAPRAWIPVSGGLPVYLDLLATIPDEKAFRAVFGVTPRVR